MTITFSLVVFQANLKKYFYYLDKNYLSIVLAKQNLFCDLNPVYMNKEMRYFHAPHNTQDIVRQLIV